MSNYPQLLTRVSFPTVQVSVYLAGAPSTVVCEKIEVKKLLTLVLANCKLDKECGGSDCCLFELR